MKKPLLITGLLLVVLLLTNPHLVDHREAIFEKEMQELPAAGLGLDASSPTVVEKVYSSSRTRHSRKDRFAAESAQQFYDDFELVDEDANTAPFNNDRQVVIYKLLDFVKDRLEQEEGVDAEHVKEIVQEIKALQAHIPAITKAALLKEVSKIYAKVKVFSMQTFVAVYDVAKKEVIKAALYGGLKEANVFFHNLNLH